MGIEWEFYTLFPSTMFLVIPLLLYLYVQLILWLYQAMKVSICSKKKKVVTETLRNKGINLTLEGFKVNYLNQVLVTCRDLYAVCSHLLFGYLIP